MRLVDGTGGTRREGQVGSWETFQQSNQLKTEYERMTLAAGNVGERGGWETSERHRATCEAPTKAVRMRLERSGQIGVRAWPQSRQGLGLGRA